MQLGERRHGEPRRELRGARPVHLRRRDPRQRGRAAAARPERVRRARAAEARPRWLGGRAVRLARRRRRPRHRPARHGRGHRRRPAAPRLRAGSARTSSRSPAASCAPPRRAPWSRSSRASTSRRRCPARHGRLARASAPSRPRSSWPSRRRRAARSARRSRAARLRSRGAAPALLAGVAQDRGGGADRELERHGLVGRRADEDARVGALERDVACSRPPRGCAVTTAGSVIENGPGVATGILARADACARPRAANDIHWLSSSGRQTIISSVPPGTSAVPMLRMPATGSAKNIVPKRAKARSNSGSKSRDLRIGHVEPHVRDAGGRGVGPGDLEERHRGVGADRRSARGHEPRELQRRLAEAAADVEHPHAGREARPLERAAAVGIPRRDEDVAEALERDREDLVPALDGLGVRRRSRRSSQAVRGPKRTALRSRARSISRARSRGGAVVTSSRRSCEEASATARNGARERLLVDPCRAVHAADLAHVLQRGGLHLLLGGRGLVVVERADVSAHARSIRLLDRGLTPNARAGAPPPPAVREEGASRVAAGAPRSAGGGGPRCFAASPVARTASCG